METETRDCPNCAAPLHLPLGEAEAWCEYCGSHLRFVPGEEEMEVVRTREEMKYRERVAVQKAVLRNKLEQEEMDRWRATAGRVAVAALPVVGNTAARALVGAAVNRGSGCAGCGCLGLLAAVGAGAVALLGLL